MPHPVDQHVGKKFKQARMLRRMSQSEVAEQVGISFQQVQKYETGTNRISASRLFEFSQILQVPPAFFFDGLATHDGSAPKEDASMKIINALAVITDEKVKERIITLIEDVSGVTVSDAQ